VDGRTLTVKSKKYKNGIYMLTHCESWNILGLDNTCYCNIHTSKTGVWVQSTLRCTSGENNGGKGGKERGEKKTTQSHSK